ncbi:MAG: hypothetical protein WBV39_14730 [Rudaea sp.]
MTNARQAASNWLAHAQAGIDARRAKTFGRATAGLMALPPAKAWQALTARSHAGDVSAATAATRLALECKMWKTNPPSEIATARRLDAAGQGLPAHWAEFLRYIGMHEYARENARARDCAQVGGIWDFMRMAIDRFMQPDNPELALVEAEQIEDDGKAIGQLRRLSSQLGSEEARRALGKRLLESHNTNNHEEGLELLESLSASDPDIVAYLAHCLRNGCGAFGGDPASATTWVARAADLGDWFAIQWTMADLEATSHPIDALTWALYRQDLAFAGCYEIGQQPSLIWIGQAIRDALRLEQPLDEVQRRQAETATHAIETRWSAKAMLQLDCNS